MYMRLCFWWYVSQCDTVWMLSTLSLTDLSLSTTDS